MPTAQLPAITGIAHVQVAITPGSEGRARAFYGTLLGLPELLKPAALAERGGCWFRCGSQQIHCGVEAEVAVTRRHAALLAQNLDALRERLTAAGIETASDGLFPGYRRFYAIDPFGNRLEFLEPEETS